MIYLIGGSPRVGKTNLAEELAGKTSFPYFSLDHVTSVITPYLKKLGKVVSKSSQIVKLMKNTQQKIFGNETHRREFSGFAVTECFYPANATMPRHTHEIAHVSFVLQGSFTEICGRKRRKSEPSTLIVHPPDEDHTVTFHDAGARIFSFHVKNKTLDRIRDFTDILDAPSVVGSGQTRWLAARLYQELLLNDTVTPLMVEGLSLEIIAEISRNAETLRERSVPKWLKKTQEYLHAHYADSISFAALAETIGTHPVYLAREFRRFFNCSMGEYVRRLRVETACRLISDSDLPLGEIALSTGFYDQSHFTNVFKRITGITPAEYRSLFRSR